MPIEITVFKPEVSRNEFIKEKAVVFTLNGQVQGFLPRSFISQELGLTMLRDATLIHIDCTKIRAGFRQDLFMASRDRLKESRNMKLLVNKIITELKSNEELKELNQLRKNAILRNTQDDKDLLEHVLSNLPVDKDLVNLLKKHGELPFFKRPGGEEKSEKRMNKDEKETQPNVSKRFPSFLKLKDIKETQEGKLVKGIPLGGKGVLRLETDVEDEYFIRSSDPGALQIAILKNGPNNSNGGTQKGLPGQMDELFSVKREGPHNGSIRVTLEPNADLNVGDEIEISLTMLSPDGDHEVVVWVKILDKQKESKPKEKPKPEQHPSLPKPIKVFKGDQNWINFQWSGDDVVKVILDNDNDTGNLIEAIAINMEAYVLERYMSKNKDRLKSASQIKMAKDKYFLSVYLHTLFLYGIMDKTLKEEKLNQEIDEIVSKLFKPYGLFLLSLNTDDAVLDSLGDSA